MLPRRGAMALLVTAIGTAYVVTFRVQAAPDPSQIGLAPGFAAVGGASVPGAAGASPGSGLVADAGASPADGTGTGPTAAATHRSSKGQRGASGGATAGSTGAAGPTATSGGASTAAAGAPSAAITAVTSGKPTLRSTLGTHGGSTAGATASAPRVTATPRPTPAPTPAPTPRPTPAPTPTPASGFRDGTWTGPGEQDPFGVVQVAVTIRGGRIVDVQASAPSGGLSGRINGQALPILRSEVLTAQSARIDAVSGATWTSQVYDASLQSALGQAKA